MSNVTTSIIFVLGLKALLVSVCARAEDAKPLPPISGAPVSTQTTNQQSSTPPTTETRYDAKDKRTDVIERKIYDPANDNRDAKKEVPKDNVTPLPAGSAKLNAQNQRNFYEVLEDLLADFEYDVRNGDVHGLKDMAIRNIALSENIPPSFKTHLELTVTERVLKNAKTRVIQCLPCKSRKTMLDGDNMVVTSPETNPVELSRIAKVGGISNMMDVAFSYQANGMILSMTIMDPETGSLVWSRSYNSESSRAAAYRRGVDYEQLDQARKYTTYQPVIQYRLSGLFMVEPNYSGYSPCVGVGFRMVERYDNRKKEIGFELDWLMDTAALAPAAEGAPELETLWSGVNLSLLFLHTWNFIGEEENYNKIRGNFFIGAGGSFTSGFFGALVRTGWEWRIAKHWAFTANVGYRPPATTLLPLSQTTTSVSGPEFGLSLSALF